MREPRLVGHMQRTTQLALTVFDMRRNQPNPGDRRSPSPLRMESGSLSRQFRRAMSAPGSLDRNIRNTKRAGLGRGSWLRWRPLHLVNRLDQQVHGKGNNKKIDERVDKHSIVYRGNGWNRLLCLR